MPPKVVTSQQQQQVNECNELTMTHAQQQQQQQQQLSSSSSYYTTQQQQQLHTRTLSDLSVGEILVKYQDDNHLLNHILVAKAQEDKRRTAEELRQAEEARLQTKFIEYELTHSNSNNNSSFGQQTHNNNNENSPLFTNTNSFIDPTNDPFTTTDHSSLQAGMDTHHDTSPMPMTTSEFHYNLQQEATSSSISSSSPSMDFISELYNNDHNSVHSNTSNNMMMSCSPPADLPLFPAPEVKSSIIPTPTPPSTSKGKKKANSPKNNMHRTLSYESVMTLSDLNIRPPPSSSSPPPPPPQPLDHDKVMEALRAKLRKSSSPYQGRPTKKPSPEPPVVVPPPNTYPTTGVLLLNLKSRRRKSSVTKRSNSSSSSSKHP